MSLLELPSYLLFYLGAFAALVLPGNVRGWVLLAVPLLSGWWLWQTPVTLELSLRILDLQLVPYRADKLSLLFAILFHIAAFLGLLFALHLRDRLQQAAAMLYVAAALGAVFSGDLLSLLVNWELLALSSVCLIWARRTPRAFAAGMRYLALQVLSGVLLLAGGIAWFTQQGDLNFGFIGLDSRAGWLLFSAFGIKAAFPLVHTWLTDAYPEATPTGTVFLSAFTTKVAIYALARGFPGSEPLIYIGAAMTCFPIFYAVIENDLRRVLAYSLINQLGFMVCGIGVGTALALNGAVAHAFNDVIFKGLLFMSMGAVLFKTGKINGSELGGLYKSMPKTAALCMVGAASISAFPLFSGFVSKSMIMSALMLEQGEGHGLYSIVWLALLFASAGVFHHAGIKIPYFAFFAHDAGIRTGEPPLNMLMAMLLAAILCVAIGCYPALLYAQLPWDADYNPYDVSHVLAQLQLLFFAALAFAWLNLKGLYPPELKSVNLDVDWVYRKGIAVPLLRWQQRLASGCSQGLARAATYARRALAVIAERHNGMSHMPAALVLPWVAVLLAVWVISSNV